MSEKPSNQRTTPMDSTTNPQSQGTAGQNATSINAGSQSAASGNSGSQNASMGSAGGQQTQQRASSNAPPGVSSQGYDEQQRTEYQTRGGSQLTLQHSGRTGSAMSFLDGNTAHAFPEGTDLHDLDLAAQSGEPVFVVRGTNAGIPIHRTVTRSQLDALNNERLPDGSPRFQWNATDEVAQTLLTRFRTTGGSQS